LVICYYQLLTDTSYPLSEGVIQVTSTSNGAVLGYISKFYDGQNSFTYSTLANAETFSVPSLTSFNTPIDITGVNGPDASHPLLGAVGGSGGYYFGSGQGQVIVHLLSGTNSDVRLQ
jgi:hypothetical protein